jgi:CheY-like chemotaxis protein
MSKQAFELLVVDDEEFIRAVLQKLLSDSGYAVALAADGEEAWEMLDSGRYKFSAILLDRVMPRLDGMGLLARIKADQRFADIPVIFQTAINQAAGIAEGIKAGAFYYLVKPVDKEVLFAIVESAVSTYHFPDAFRHAASQEQANLSRTLQRSQYRLRTLAEARTLATALSNYYPQPQRVALGISELLINAVEHGNLGISYQEKSRLLQEGGWEGEIERRLALPEHAEKKVEVQLEHDPHEIRLTISDCGEGFNSLKYMELSPERAFDPNGRGIAMSKMMSFDTLEYQGNGNQLVAVVKI